MVHENCPRKLLILKTGGFLYDGTHSKFLWRVVEGRVTFEQEEELLPIVQ